MSVSSINAPSVELPWSNGQDSRRLQAILAILLALVFVAGVLVPYIDLPEKEREEAAALPPHLAKIIERKKLEQPKPEVIEPEVVEPEVEAPPVEEVKPPEPVVKEEPKPEPVPKPKQERKVEATEQERQVARQKAEQRLGGEALQALSGLRNQVPLTALNASNQALLGSSSSATQAAAVGDAVNRSAIGEGAQGVDLTEYEGGAELVADASGEDLTGREITQVKEVKEGDAVAAPAKRSQGEIRLVFENARVQFDSIYRSALRKNPNLEGEIILALTIEPSGQVSSCEAQSSELDDARLVRRVVSKCRQLGFDNRPNVETTKVAYPIRFNP